MHQKTARYQAWIPRKSNIPAEAAIADNRTFLRISAVAAGRTQLGQVAPVERRLLLVVVDSPVPEVLHCSQESNLEVPYDVVPAGDGQAVAAAAHCSAGAEFGYLAALKLRDLRPYRLRLVLGFVWRGLQLPLGEQCQLGNRTYPIWLVLMLYLIFEVSVACFPPHESKRAL